MTELERAGQVSSGTDLPSSAYRLGVDASGDEHYHDPMSQHVWVIDDGDVVHETDLDGRSVVEWVLFVEEQLAGWTDRQPVEEAGGLGNVVEDVARRLDA